jgi:hypothetical protein
MHIHKMYTYSKLNIHNFKSCNLLFKPEVVTLDWLRGLMAAAGVANTVGTSKNFYDFKCGPDSAGSLLICCNCPKSHTDQDQ